ncbi:hypothetical protein COY52_06295 [Candidatus Desantisbacteria bacterium CG_4_10_14_0_8_um_filter_48_22]|uniref:FHA domain-containing protein n=1 Tax=Candidatus Desantisbacteria bacterium CG_4_10_14_0_8_um_filter_48_22 TaxID=1974543 RepID=A0A2M7SB21_9BACT|nr:MAG: hypothetical protein AUJ67_06355 [Candidatus Desantisbacteria bacterium CG1_02_49_89]PIV55401.1 MAG: hypothetical protein COS16_07215 [Candidatus Desantisbacteria bacterium CG02_land_8_20_14_3_00_49_13]PIZ16708.1 MAG: hypothetical protein COY52_06295 [Candidatus Desantisbacteria bacterium CG_4_10_14_0_8_um_filter_48_22]PJB27879.1 MAG: hypothetical protein CO111_03050 [Candidatus Desantisbacteria bacterium CG_4_9_14_3_um_filter_50_7]
MARLTVMRGDKEGWVAELPQKEFTIGRDPTNDFIISDIAVSRKHAIIRFRSGKYSIQDYSVNGTKIGDKRIKKTVLEEGDKIEIGGTLFRFETEAPLRHLQKVKQPEPSSAVRETAEGTTVIKTPARASRSAQPFWYILLAVAAVSAAFYFSFKAPIKRISVFKTETAKILPFAPSAEHSSDPQYYFSMANRLYKEKGVNDSNLFFTIQYLRKGLELYTGGDSETVSFVTRKMADIGKELETKVKDEMFGAYQAFHLDNTQDCRAHLESVMRLVPDPSDPYHRSARAKLSALK